MPITCAIRVGRDQKCEELLIGEIKTEAYGLAGKRGQVGAVVPFDLTLRGVIGEPLGGGEHFVVGTKRFNSQFATTFTNGCRPLNFNGRVVSGAKYKLLALFGG